MGKRTNRGLAKLSLPVPRLAKGDTPQARLALVRAAGGPHDFLATKGLQALAALPQLSAKALVTAESWELQVAEMRIRQCQACPPMGGACDQRSRHYRAITVRSAFGVMTEPSDGNAADLAKAGMLAQGQTPEWRSGLGSRECTRWPEYALQRRLAEVGVPPELLPARLSSYKPRSPAQDRALSLCAEFCRDYPARRDRGAGIFLQGSTGQGKSHLAVSVLAELLATDLRLNVAFVYVPDLLQQAREDLRYQRDGRTLERIGEVPLLVLDDLGVESSSAWTQEQIETVLHHRTSRQLTTVLTTNESIETLEKRYNERSMRRCYQMCETRLQLLGDYIG
jgi:DNA replication protein DnaC